MIFDASWIEEIVLRTYNVATYFGGSNNAKSQR